jgi:flavin reductase (DIM6/NTAB) family NADH-FMN oxidoreductase RutF
MDPPAHAVTQVFDTLAGELEYPMFIVTVAHGGERSGCLMGFATQCSIDPPRFIACISVNNHTFRVGRDARAMAVHLVPADADDLVELFGGETGDELDKFARCDWHEGPEGLPIIDRCGSWFAGHVLERVDAGDHHAFLLEAFAAEHAGDGQYSVHRAARVEPGHEA